MKLVDEQVTKRRTHKTKIGTGKDAKTETKVDSGPMPQVALVALDPHTGEVLALVGGRNYGMSQLDHAIAKRPTGSIFKPFVYAAAINTALTGETLTPASDERCERRQRRQRRCFTPATLVDDSPVSIAYGDQVYEPRNYKQEYHGEVTARYALAMSLNNATVKVAQEVGFGKVAALAKAAGISSVRATPAIALGAYDATPLEMAGAYTVFANGGTRLSPIMVKSVRDSRGKALEDYHTDSKPVLDPRVAYVLTTMMESVVNNGTGYTGPRARIPGSRGGQDRHLARRLVCRLHDEPAVHRLGGQRRLHRPEAERQLDGRAHLGRVHEAGRQAAAVLRREELPCSVGRGRSDAGQADQPAGDLYLSAGLHRRLHRGHRTEGNLRRSLHRSPGNLHQDPRTGHASGRSSAAHDQRRRRSRRERDSGPDRERPARREPAASSQEEERVLQPALRQGRQQQ